MGRHYGYRALELNMEGYLFAIFVNWVVQWELKTMSCAIKSYNCYPPLRSQQ